MWIPTCVGMTAMQKRPAMPGVLLLRIRYSAAWAAGMGDAATGAGATLAGAGAFWCL
jgi:hypothetical protein